MEHCDSATLALPTAKSARSARLDCDSSTSFECTVALDRMRVPVCLAGVFLGLGLLVDTGIAHAEAAPPTAERIRSAAKEYDEGRRLFVAGEFEQAAIHFENAYNDAPRAEALRNAIRARAG